MQGWKAVVTLPDGTVRRKNVTVGGGRMDAAKVEAHVREHLHPDATSIVVTWADAPASPADALSMAARGEGLAPAPDQAPGVLAAEAARRETASGRPVGTPDAPPIEIRGPAATFAAAPTAPAAAEADPVTADATSAAAPAGQVDGPGRRKR